MEELFELRTAIEEQRYADALILLGEMEEMSKDDKLNKIDSFAIILLLHLIKQHAEQRTTRSWDFSIYNAVRQIRQINKRRKLGGYYFKIEELQECITEAYSTALKMAALETFEGQFSEEQLAQKVKQTEIEKQAYELISSG